MLTKKKIETTGISFLKSYDATMAAKSWIKGQNKMKTITKSTFIPWMHDKDASETAVGSVVLR